MRYFACGLLAALVLVAAAGFASATDYYSTYGSYDYDSGQGFSYGRAYVSTPSASYSDSSGYDSYVKDAYKSTTTTYTNNYYYGTAGCCYGGYYYNPHSAYSYGYYTYS